MWWLRGLDSKLGYKVRAVVAVVVVSRFGLAVMCYAGKRKDLGSIPLRLSFLFRKVVVCGRCLVTLSLTINGTLKRLSSLPILMQKSFWWMTV